MYSKLIPSVSIFIWKGEISWFWDIQVKIYCDFNYRNYPLDKQKCKFRVLYEDHQYKDVWQKYLNDNFEEGLILDHITSQRSLNFDFYYRKIPDEDRIRPWEQNTDCNVDGAWCQSWQICCAGLFNWCKRGLICRLVP